MRALRPVRGRRGDDPPRARRAARDRAAERVLAVVARARGGDPARRSRSSASASCRSARSARASSPARSTQTTTFDSTDFRNTVPRFSAEARKANQALVDAARPDRGAEAGDAGADRAGLAAGAEAVDRADPRHDQAHRLEENLRRGRRRAHAPRTCGRSTLRRTA